jgi:sterol desaturase/sphingolipid hydroxylase (fatty acid hydroxylase superfamily)
VSKRWKWLAIGLGVGALVVIERLRPLREPREPGPERVGRNLIIGVIGAAATVMCELPIVRPVHNLAERRHLGLLRWLRLPRTLRVILGFLLLDYTLYLWHWMAHRSRWLWRFHAVHHLDRDMDSSTGVRFHFGELTLSVGLRAAQALLLGVDRDTFRVYQQALFFSVLFHHSNLGLPMAAERGLAAFVVTPRMHGIHHSTRVEQANTNYSSLLSWWDRIHGTLRLNVPQREIEIGVNGFTRPDDVTLERSLALPFERDPRLLPQPPAGEVPPHTSA